MKPAVRIITDGSCRNGHPGGGYCAIVVFDTGIKIVEKIITGRTDDNSSNIRMEMVAVIAGFSSLKQSCAVHLTTDLQMIAFGLTNYLPYWVAHGWKNPQRKTPKNDDLWKQIHALVQMHDVSVSWTKGHEGHYYNNLADKYAGKARLGELTNVVNYLERK